MHRAKVTFEGLFVLFVGTAVTIWFRHYLIWACIAGAFLCLLGLWLIGTVHRRASLCDFETDKDPSITTSAGASIAMESGTGGTPFLVHVAENRFVAPMVDTVATVSGSSSRWDAAMDIARARSAYYSVVASSISDTESPTPTPKSQKLSALASELNLFAETRKFPGTSIGLAISAMSLSDYQIKREHEAETARQFQQRYAQRVLDAADDLRSNKQMTAHDEDTLKEDIPTSMGWNEKRLTGLAEFFHEKARGLKS